MIARTALLPALLVGALLLLGGCPSTAEGALPTRPAAADPGDWCAGHGVPESMCTKCNPALTERYRAAGDFCAAHGFPESVCPLCNPLTPPDGRPSRGAPEEPGAHANHADAAGDGALATRPAVADANDWCIEHGLPESMCTKCNPALVERYRAAGDFCAEHGFPESVCPLCHPLTPPAGGLRVRLADAAVADAAGLERVPARRQAMAAGVTAPGRLSYDPDHLAEVRATVAGRVLEVKASLGAEVAAGDPLFVLESAEVGALQARRRAARQRLSVARADLERQRELARAQVSSARQVELAEREVAAAEAEVRSLRRALEVSGAGAGGSRYVVRAPLAGVLVQRPAVTGTLAGPDDLLAVVADPGRLWVELELREVEAGGVRPGQRLTLDSDALAVPASGTVAFVAPEVDRRTRTVAVHARIPNPDGRLRAGQFVRGRVALGAPATGVAVPREAVQQGPDGPVVFVETGPGLYEPRAVTAVRRDGDWVQVEGEVEAGDPVVTTGAFLLKTELMPDAIGAGCCEGVEE